MSGPNDPPNNKHVLIVEDSAELQYLLAYLFKTEGFTFSQAYNGQEALAILRASETLPAFILLDVMMPIMDGVAFRQEQKKDRRLANVPVVMMTADSQPDEKAKLMDVEFFFKKPIKDIDKLIELATRFSHQ